MLSIKAAPSSVSCSRRSACSVPHIHRVEQRVVKANVLGMSFNNAQNPMADAAKRSDVVRTDVTDYFECQGFLAAECNYDRVDAMLEVLEPIDALLILTVQENDQGKALEMLKAGANPNAKCHKGNSALSIAESMKKPDLVALLKKYIK